MREGDKKRTARAATNHNIRFLLRYCQGLLTQASEAVMSLGTEIGKLRSLPVDMKTHGLAKISVACELPLE